MAKQPLRGLTTLESSSNLKTGAERFLSQVVSYALDHGFRTPEDFLRQFPPLELMQSLELAPELRKDILVMAAGTHEKIARRKSAQSAAEDLRFALDEGVTTAADVLEVFSSDDRVRYLNRVRLFAFAVEDAFYSGQKTTSEHEKAVERLLFILEAAISEQLVSLPDVASSIGFETIAHRMPMRELQRLVEHALILGSNGAALSPHALFEVVPLRSLLSYVPMDLVWSKVIESKVLVPTGLLDASKLSLSDERPSSPEMARAETDGVRAEPATTSHPAIAKDLPPKPPATNGKKLNTEEPKRFVAEPRASKNDAEAALGGTVRLAPPADDARTRVIERLGGINRLPTRHDELSTPILLSIESMYSELLVASSDQAREEAIRDSFPNEVHMTQALLALIELLDPSIDVNDPVIREADIDSLIKVVVFEERHRYEQAHTSQREAPGQANISGVMDPPPPLVAGQTAVPPLPPPVRRTMPPPPLPPLPRGSPLPPLPPAPPLPPPPVHAEKLR